MPPNPPLDMITTRSPGGASAAIASHDRVDVGQVTGGDARRPPGPAPADLRTAARRLAGSTGTPTRSRPDRPRANARAKSSWKIRRQDEAERGSKTAQMRASGCAARSAASVSATAVGMMGEVVVDDDVALRADDFEPPLHAEKRRQSFARDVEIDAALCADGDRGQRVLDVVHAGERHAERAAVVLP